MRLMIPRAALAVALVLLSISLGFAVARTTGIAAAADATASSSVVNVSIDNYAFKAPQITIPAGTTVVWTNKDDDPHTVTADDGSFDSKGLGQGDAFKHVFSKPGTYPYHCSAHPYMKGVVTVQGEK
ncbi:MAG TPA: cupredoxin family copper-binding protein [Candidatus Binatus sp.]|nr:cupredoxin family copper-binding protein [Candidatus Binatus sp.]